MRTITETMQAFRHSIAFAPADVSSAAAAGAVSDAAIAAGVEPEEMDAGGIGGVVLAVTALVVVIVVAVFQMVNLEVQDVRREVAAAATDVSGLAQLRVAATAKLSQYEPLTATPGKYRIPIDRAMELMANETYRNPSGRYTGQVVLLRE